MAQGSKGSSTGAGFLVAALVVAILVVKVSMLGWLMHGIWIDGAGTRRFAEILAMRSNGINVPDIDVFSAGYSILVHGITVAAGVESFWPVSVIQSVVFSYAVWYLALALPRTRVGWAMVPFAFVAVLNPALSLSTIALAPGGLASALLMIAVGLMIRDLTTRADQRRPWRILLGAMLFGLATFIVPAVGVGAIAALIGWASARGNREQAISIGSAAVAVLLVLPLALLARNQIANNEAFLPMGAEGTASTAVTTSSSGAVLDRGSRCGVSTLDFVSLNVPKFRCLMAWYQDLSAQTSRDAAPNAVDFWTPWAGPLHDRSVTDNPWVVLHPVHLIGDDDPRSILTSPIATGVSWLWMLGSLVALLAGIAGLRQLGAAEHEVSIGTGWLVVGAWLVGVLTMANADSRIPVMGPVLLLQVIGWRFLFTRGRPSGKDPFIAR